MSLPQLVAMSSACDLVVIALADMYPAYFFTFVFTESSNAFATAIAIIGSRVSFL